MKTNLRDKSIYEILEEYPKLISLFLERGFEQFNNREKLRLLGKAINLETLCKTRKINIEDFERSLLEEIEKAEARDDNKGLVKLKGILPCPVKYPLTEAFEKWLEENKDSLKVDTDLRVASGGVNWLEDEVREIKDESELADIYISAGFDLFFEKKMMGRFKDKGAFKDLLKYDGINKTFKDKNINLRDPKGEYSIIAVVPAIFLVNEDELRGRDMPRSWEDLLKPEFEGEISLPVKDFDLFNGILLNIYKKFGQEGIKKLGRSFMLNMHPSEMVKSHRKKEKPTVTIMPYFFTKMVKGTGPMKPVWPEDGAIISPIFLLTKGEKRSELEGLVDFFSSDEIGELLAKNGKFPVTNPNVDNEIEDDKNFIWLGWDYIDNNDLGEKIKSCEELFFQASRGGY